MRSLALFGPIYLVVAAPAIAQSVPTHPASDAVLGTVPVETANWAIPATSIPDDGICASKFVEHVVPRGFLDRQGKLKPAKRGEIAKQVAATLASDAARMIDKTDPGYAGFTDRQLATGWFWRIEPSLTQRKQQLLAVCIAASPQTIR